jgi:hypothetical protein
MPDYRRQHQVGAGGPRPLAKQEKERILEPELPIIDTHHHFWDRGDWASLAKKIIGTQNGKDRFLAWLGQNP